VGTVFLTALARQGLFMRLLVQVPEAVC